MRKLALILLSLICVWQPISAEIGDTFTYSYNRGPNIKYEITDENKKTVQVVNNINIKDTRGHVDVPSSVTNNGVNYTVTEIGGGAFFGQKTPSISLPNSLISIGGQAFKQCSMSSISIPNSVTSIGGFAFWYATKLTTINFPNSVNDIGEQAFKECKNLSSVSIGSGITFIGDNAFGQCPNLTSISILAEAPPSISENFGLDSNIPVYVLARYADAYKNDNKWNQYNIQPAIKINQEEAELTYTNNPDNPYTVSVTCNLNDETLIWTTNNSTVASVAASGTTGNITMNGVGKARITVKTSNGFYDYCDITVTPDTGDSNWDGKIDVGDAVNIAYFVLENFEDMNNWNPDNWDEEEWIEFYKKGADINGQPGITFADASKAVSLVLAQDASPSATESTRSSFNESTMPSDALVVCKASAASHDNIFIPVALDGSMEYVALQANIRVPEGMTLEYVKAGEGASYHTLSTRRIDDRTMRVVLFDFNNHAFDDGRSILEIIAKGNAINTNEIEISDAVASDMESNSHSLSTRGEGISGVGSISADSVTVNTTGTGIMVRNANGKRISVCNVDGTAVRSFVATSDAETISLPKGLYIVSTAGIPTKIAVK